MVDVLILVVVQVLLRTDAVKNPISMLCLSCGKHGLGINTLVEIAERLVAFGTSTQEVNPAVLKQQIKAESQRILEADYNLPKV